MLYNVSFQQDIKSRYCSRHTRYCDLHIYILLEELESTKPPIGVLRKHLRSHYYLLYFCYLHVEHCLPAIHIHCIMSSKKSSLAAFTLGIVTFIHTSGRARVYMPLQATTYNHSNRL